MRAALLALQLMPTIAAAQSVHTVDDDGPADFADLQSAVDAAAPGDVVLVASGTYAAFTVSGKGLFVTADLGALVELEGCLTISAVPAGESFVLRGLLPPSDLSIPVVWSSLRIVDCAGPVWVEQATFSAAGQQTYALGSYSCNANLGLIHVEDSDDVTLVRVESYAFLGWPALSTTANEGLSVVRSHVRLLDSRVVGREGFGAVTLDFGKPGEAGAVVRDGTLFASDSELVGGLGGAAWDFEGCIHGGPGGPGLVVEAGGLATLLDTATVGGAGYTALCTPQPDGEPIVLVDDGAVVQEPGIARRVVTTSPHRVGESWGVFVLGVPGDLVFLIGSGQLAALGPIPGIGGQALLGIPFATVFAGTIPASEVLDVPGVVGPLQPGVSAAGRGIQAVLVGADLSLTFSSASHQLLLAAGS